MDFGRQRTVTGDDEIKNLQLVDLDEEHNVSLREVNFKKGVLKTNSGKNLDELVKKDNQVYFCICVDGSKHCEYAFETVINNFLSKESRMFLVHIYNSQQDEFYNYTNKKDTVIGNFKSKVIPFKGQTQFIAEDRVSKVHALEQVSKLCKAYNTDILVLGFYGIKGPKGDNKEMTKGIDFLLSNSMKPFMIIQNNVNRRFSKTGGFNWLFVIDKHYGNNCLKVLTNFLPFIDIYADYVQCNAYIPSSIVADEVEAPCNEIAKSHNFANYVYKSEFYQSSLGIGKSVVDLVNFGQIPFDFVVIFNNPDRYKANKEKSDITTIISRCVSNICVTQNS